MNLKDAFEYEINTHYGVTPQQANAVQLHAAISRAAMSTAQERYAASMSTGKRRAYYLSAEFLIGRSVFNNLFNLGLLDEAKALFHACGHDLNELEDIEDAALGNGGLGRLAACYLESAATLNLPLDGYGIRYKYGLFKQSFVDGFQVETPDDWQKCLDPWSVRCDEDAVLIHMLGREVLAVPYDMPTYGYQSKRVGRLRLWQCEALSPFNFAVFDSGDYDDALKERTFADSIHMVLYPNDNSENGKMLRLMQQYFFAAASVSDILREYRHSHGDNFENLAAFVSVQLNDTHPVVAIPEMIRVLMLDGELSFNAAFAIVCEVFNYTNHTIMQEALEKWNVSLFKKVLPDVYAIILQMQKQLTQLLSKSGIKKAAQAPFALVTKESINMANIAVFASRYVNGVAQLHTKLLREDVLAQWYQWLPNHFQNKTNGVTQRRWLGLCNPELTDFLADKLGSKSFLKDLYALNALSSFAGDKATQDAFNVIKKLKKQQLADYVWVNEGIQMNADAIFDIQVKRLHEYKRQLMSALAILYLYNELKDGNIPNFHPMCFIFGAKSAPGYKRAKGIIKLINEMGKLVNNDKDVNHLISVVFVQNYNVSYAEKIIPAADISEQISTAGTEASGTGNMKLMLNGAVTLGTYDGANIEIVSEAGLENNYIFGARVQDIRQMEASYNPCDIVKANPKVERVMNALVDGSLNDGGTGLFKELYTSLMEGASWHKPDHYFVLYDLLPYVEAKLKVNQDYQSRNAFAKKALMNIAGAGKFSSDRSIAEYAKDIWHIEA